MRQGGSEEGGGGGGGGGSTQDYDASSRFEPHGRYEPQVRKYRAPLARLVARYCVVDAFCAGREHPCEVCRNDV